MRLVSLTCSNTEIVHALGLGHWLVGVDDHSDSPAELVQNLPRVGPDLSVSMDKIRALNPDLVLASMTVPGHENNLEALKNANIKHIVTQPESMDGVFQSILKVADILGVSEKGQSLVQRMKAEFTPVATDSMLRKPRIAVQWWPKPIIIPGKLSWVHQLITAAGGINLLGQEDVTSRPLENTEFVDLNPDIIILSWCGVDVENYRPDVVYNNAALQGINALKNKQIFPVSESLLGRPSPGLLSGFQQLKLIISQWQNRN